MYNASRNAFVVAFLLPLNASLPASIGGGAALVIETAYPFGDNATLDVRVPEGHTTTAHVRIPGWAVGATVNGAPAPNGTLVPIDCAAGSTRVQVSLPASIRVERGWGTHGQLAQAPIVYGDGEHGGGVRAAAEAGGEPSASPLAAPRSVPSGAEIDWEVGGGASFVPSRAGGGEGVDVRSGQPGGTAWLVNAHPIYGKAHNVTSLGVALSYIAGFSPPSDGNASAQKAAAVASVHLLDAVSRVDIAGAIVTLPPLSKYSYDHFIGYSPPIRARIANLSLPNGRPLLVALKIENRERNAQIPLASISLDLEWSPTATPSVTPSPVSKWLSPPANSAVIRRGPLLFALHPKEEFRMIRDYYQMLPMRPHAVDWQISTREPWAYALSLADDPAPDTAPLLSFDPAPSKGWSPTRPFNTEEFPFSIRVAARQLPEELWGYWAGSKITAQPPPSPLDNASRLPRAVLRLVPFGGTNIRISVFPWHVAEGP